jgi:predicted nucleic acid-binding protein
MRHILPLNQETAEIWGRCTAGAQQKGFTIPVADGLIAATALQHGLFVATRNTRHFDVTGASVVNPWLAPIGSEECPLMQRQLWTCPQASPKRGRTK